MKKRKGRSGILIAELFITLLFFAGFSYLTLPALNIHSRMLWFSLILSVLLFGLLHISAQLMGEAWDQRVKKTTYLPLITGFLMAVVFLIGIFYSLPVFHARKYANLISDRIQVQDWSSVETLDKIENIALMDSNTAAVFGNRKLGELSDLVSQYRASTMYSQITLEGQPMKAATLEYDGFWKWLSNHKDGVPGYILVDPVKMSGKYVKLEDAIHYSPSELFQHDLNRKLRFEYPTKLIGTPYFEIDDEGNPYYIAPTYRTTIGLFGGTLVEEVIVFDPLSGEHEIMPAEQAYEWIDVIYNGDYLTERLDYWGEYQNGFLNTLFSKKDCRMTTKDEDSETSDFGYLTIENDIWVYTGVTSVTSDSSNIGVVMCNERTGDILYYSVPGADENSAMRAAEGEVQQYGYRASFPSLINVNGEPTYVMVLCDNNSIVKSYAMVSYNNYSKVAVADNLKKVFALYAEEMELDIAVPEDAEENAEYTTEADLEIASIHFIVESGNTYVYVKDSEDHLYRTRFEERWLLMNEGDRIQVLCAEPDDRISREMKLK